METDERAVHLRLLWLGAAAVVIAAILDAAIEWPRANVALATFPAASGVPGTSG